MKKFSKKLLCVAGIVGLTLSSASYAQSSRTLNPGDDPNEDIISKETEATVASVGACRECVKNLVHGRINDNTTSRSSIAGGSGASSGSQRDNGSGSVKSGTR